MRQSGDPSRTSRLFHGFQQSHFFEGRLTAPGGSLPDDSAPKGGISPEPQTSTTSHSTSPRYRKRGDIGPFLKRPVSLAHARGLPRWTEGRSSVDAGERAGVDKVVRKTASSGKVDYAPPVILRETSKSRLQAMAWFIPHSDRTEFSLKLEGFTKTKDQPWIEDKAKTLTLTEEASRQLFKYLQDHLAVAEQSETGQFILVRISDGQADLKGHDPQQLVEVELTRFHGHVDVSVLCSFVHAVSRILPDVGSVSEVGASSALRTLAWRCARS